MNTDIIKTYKRFDKDMSYLGFKYEVGKEYDVYDGIKFVGNGDIINMLNNTEIELDKD